VNERAEDAGIDRCLDVGVGGDDVAVVPAELQGRLERFSPAVAATPRPTGVEPVKATTSLSG